MKQKRFKLEGIIDSIKKMPEVIKENQYRISVVILCTFCIGVLVYFFILANQGWNTFKDFVLNPVNWVIIISVILVSKMMNPLVKQIWKQTDIRDKTEEINLELKRQELEKMKSETELVKLEIDQKRKLQKKF